MATVYELLPLDVRAKYPIGSLTVKWQERLASEIPAGTTREQAQKFGQRLAQMVPRMTAQYSVQRAPEPNWPGKRVGEDTGFANPMAPGAPAPAAAPSAAPVSTAALGSSFQNPFVSPEERDAARLEEADARSRAEIEDNFRKMNWAVRQALIIGRHFKGFGLEQFVRAVEDVADPPPVLAEGPEAAAAMVEWQKRHTERVAALQQEQIDLHTAIPEGRGAERITEILAGLAKFTADTGLASLSGADPTAALGYAGQVNEVDLKHRATAAATTMAAGKLSHGLAARIAPEGAGVARRVGAQIPGGVVFGGVQPAATVAANKGLAAAGVGPEDANAPWPSLAQSGQGALELTATNIALFLLGRGTVPAIRTELAAQKRARRMAEYRDRGIVPPEVAAARASLPSSPAGPARTRQAEPAPAAQQQPRPSMPRQKAVREAEALFNEQNAGKKIRIVLPGEVEPQKLTLVRAGFDVDGTVRVVLSRGSDGAVIPVEFGSAEEFAGAMRGTKKSGATGPEAAGVTPEPLDAAVEQQSRFSKTTLEEVDFALAELDKSRPKRSDKRFKRWERRRQDLLEVRARLEKKGRAGAAGETPAPDAAPAAEPTAPASEPAAAAPATAPEPAAPTPAPAAPTPAVPLPTHYTRSNGEMVEIRTMGNDHLLNAERKAKDGPEREAMRAEIVRRKLTPKGQKPAPAAPATPAPSAPAAPAAGDEPRLPSDLAGAKPGYNFGLKRFQPKFDSDIDRAAFIVSQKSKSKRDADYRKFLADQGMTDAEIAAHGARVRKTLRARAAVLESGAELRIEKHEREKPADAAPAPAPEPPAAEEPPAERAPAYPEEAFSNRQHGQSIAGGKESDQESAAVRAGVEGKTFTEAAQWLADNSPREATRAIARALARRLAEIERKTKAGKVVFNEPVTRGSQATYGRKADGSAHYIRMRPGGGAYKLLHELVHAATENLLGPEIPGLKDRDLDAQTRADIDALHKFVKSKLGKTDDILSKYGTSDASEMFSVGMTDPVFQKMLEGLEYQNGTAWDKFVDIVRKALGLEPNQHTALSELMRLGAELLKTDEDLAKKENPVETKPEPEPPVVEPPAAETAAPPESAPEVASEDAGEGWTTPTTSISPNKITTDFGRGFDTHTLEPSTIVGKKGDKLYVSQIAGSTMRVVEVDAKKWQERQESLREGRKVWLPAGGGIGAKDMPAEMPEGQYEVVKVEYKKVGMMVRVRDAEGNDYWLKRERFDKGVDTRAEVVSRFEKEFESRPASDTRTAHDIASEILSGMKLKEFPEGFDAEVEAGRIIQQKLSDAGQGDLFGGGPAGAPPPPRDPAETTSGPGVRAAEGGESDATVEGDKTEAGRMKARDLDVLPHFQDRSVDLPEHQVDSGTIQGFLRSKGGYKQSDIEQEPLTVWTDETGHFGEKGKTYVLSGHHRRYLAMNKWVKDANGEFRTDGMSDNEVPVIRVHVTPERAREIAEFSNRKSMRTRYAEDMKAARKIIDGGGTLADVKAKLQIRTNAEAQMLVSASHLSGDSLRLVEDPNTRPHAAVLGEAAKRMPDYYTPALQADIARKIIGAQEGYGKVEDLKQTLAARDAIVAAARQGVLGGDVLLANTEAIVSATRKLNVRVAGVRSKVKGTLKTLNGAKKLNDKVMTARAERLLKEVEKEQQRIEKVLADYTPEKIGARLGAGLERGIPVEKTLAEMRAELDSRLGPSGPGGSDTIDTPLLIDGDLAGLDDRAKGMVQAFAPHMIRDMLDDIPESIREVRNGLPAQRALRVYNSRTGQYSYDAMYEPDPWSESWAKRFMGMVARSTGGRFAQLKDIATPKAFRRYEASHAYLGHFLGIGRQLYKTALGPTAATFMHGSREAKRIALVQAGKMSKSKLPQQLQHVPVALEGAYHDLRDYSNWYARRYGRSHVYSFGVQEVAVPGAGSPQQSAFSQPGARHFVVAKDARIFDEGMPAGSWKVIKTNADGSRLVETDGTELRTWYGGPHVVAQQFADSTAPLIEVMFGGELTKAEIREATNRFFEMRLGTDSQVYDAVAQFEIYHKAMARYLSLLPFFEQAGRDYLSMRLNGEIDRSEALKAVVALQFFKKTNRVERWINDRARDMVYQDTGGSGLELTPREAKSLVGKARYKLATAAGVKKFWRVDAKANLTKNTRRNRWWYSFGKTAHGDRIIGTDGRSPVVADPPELRAGARWILGRSLDMQSMFGKPKGMSRAAYRKILSRRASHEIILSHRDPAKFAFAALGHATHLSVLGYNFRSALNNSAQIAVTLIPEWGFRNVARAVAEQVGKSALNKATWAPRIMVDQLESRGLMTARTAAKWRRVLAHQITGSEKAKMLGVLQSELAAIHDAHVAKEKSLFNTIVEHVGPMAAFRLAEDFSRGLAVLAAENQARRWGMKGPSVLDQMQGVKIDSPQHTALLLKVGDEISTAGTRASLAARITSQTMFDYGPFGRPGLTGGGLDRVLGILMTFPVSFMEKATRPIGGAGKVVYAGGRMALDKATGGRAGKPAIKSRYGEGDQAYVKRGRYVESNDIGRAFTEYGANAEDRKFAAMLVRQAVIFGVMSAASVATNINFMFPGVVGWEPMMLRLMYPNAKKRPEWVKKVIAQADKASIVRGVPMSPAMREVASALVESDSQVPLEPKAIAKAAADKAGEVARLHVPFAASAKRAIATSPGAGELREGGKYSGVSKWLGIKTVYPSKDAGQYVRQNTGLEPEWERDKVSKRVKRKSKYSKFGGLGSGFSGLGGL